MIALGELFVLNDTLDALLLGAFFFGLAFSGVSLLIGVADLGGGHVGHGHGGHGHANGGHGSDSLVSIFNIASILAFVTWFGGIAYLLRNGASFPGVVAVLIGLIAGFAASVVVMRLLRFMKRQETYLDASRERLTGSLGRVTLPIRAGGTGEIVYELNGVRQVSAARVDGGVPIPRGAEVIVVRRERGIAYVEPASRLNSEDDWEQRFDLADGVDRSHPPPQIEAKVHRERAR